MPVTKDQFALEDLDQRWCRPSLIGERMIA
jgi:hypothetical protein